MNKKLQNDEIGFMTEEKSEIFLLTLQEMLNFSRHKNVIKFQYFLN